MQVMIESPHLGESNKSRATLEQRVRYAFRRMQDNVQQIRVSLHDINGPRGGIDKQCRLTLKLAGRGTLTVSSQAHDSSLALDNALKRASQSLTRRWQRRRRSIRGLRVNDSLNLQPIV